MKIDTALYNNEKRHQLEGYFIVDTNLAVTSWNISCHLDPPVYGSTVTASVAEWLDRHAK
jgi:hypothetical protein